MHPVTIYKIVPADLWSDAEATGRFQGSPIDRQDGFIHLSTSAQVRETAARHCAGATDLLLVAVSTVQLEVRWEPSRGGDLFPHLYDDLPLAAVEWVQPLPLGQDGRHVFPALERQRPGAQVNTHGQLVGAPLPDWTPPMAPPREAMSGRYCDLVPLSLSAADGLFDALALDEDDRQWTYLPYGPFASREAFRDWVSTSTHLDDPLLFAIHSGDDRSPTGIAGYLRMTPAGGSIEVGHLRFSKRLQRTPAATEAMYLMMKQAFELGFRRYEWKCDALNAPSRRAAARLGFSFEGTFRQGTVYKGRTRDTAWFSVIDGEWPALKQAFEAWLDPGNFDTNGHQKRGLSAVRNAGAT